MRWSNCSDALLENALRPGNILRFQAGMFPADVWLLLAGLRPSCPAAATSTTRLHFGLLGNLQRIVDLDPEVSDRALEFAVTEQ